MKYLKSINEVTSKSSVKTKVSTKSKSKPSDKKVNKITEEDKSQIERIINDVFDNIDDIEISSHKIKIYASGKSYDDDNEGGWLSYSLDNGKITQDRIEGTPDEDSVKKVIKRLDKSVLKALTNIELEETYD